MWLPGEGVIVFGYRHDRHLKPAGRERPSLMALAPVSASLAIAQSARRLRH